MYQWLRKCNPKYRLPLGSDEERMPGGVPHVCGYPLTVAFLQSVAPRGEAVPHIPWLDRRFSAHD